MPTTRAARRAARCLTEVLPADALGLVLYQLPLAHDIASVAPTCHALCDAAKLTGKARPYSGKVVTLAGHVQAVQDVAAAPNGRIITGADDGMIKVWRDGAGKSLRTIRAHETYVEGVAMLPDGARFVSGSSDCTAKLWTLDGALERTFKVGQRHWVNAAPPDGWVYAIAALPDGVHFVVGLGGSPSQGEIRLYHVDGTLVHTFTGHTTMVGALAVTPGGQHIISGSFDNLVKVWSVASKSLVSTCDGHTDRVTAVAAMPDGQRFLSGSLDATVRVWLFDGTPEKIFWLHDKEMNGGGVRALVGMPDNQHALSSSNDTTIKLFNVNDGAVLLTFTHHTAQVGCLALLPDGLRFASGSNDKTARIAYHGLAPHK